MLTAAAGASSVANDMQANAAKPGKSDSLQDRFLTMLTAELKNQDPTNPMSNTEMVTQLSQLSTSQGISDLKKLSQSQIMAMLGMQRLASSNLIGKSVEYKADSVNITKSHHDVSGFVDAPADSKQVTVEIKNSAGDVIKTIDVSRNDNGKFAWSWDGKNKDGHAVEPASYSVGLSGKQSGSVLVNGKVAGVNFKGDGSTILSFDNGESANMNEVSSIDSAKSQGE